MKSFLKELFEYNHHCNQQLADLFLANPEKTPEKSIELFSHILNAHRVWNNRIDPLQPAYGIWEVHPVQHFKSLDQINHEHTLFLLEKCTLSDNVSYTTSKGTPFNNSTRDILFHVINHSTYHRGQIAMEFRRSGIEPLVTDYIFYKR